MPAQILPLIDDSDNVAREQALAIAQQRSEMQMQYQQQLMGLKEAQFQVEQSLNPMRQQMMASELERSKTALQSAVQAMKQQAEIHPNQVRESAARAKTAETQSDLAGAQSEEWKKFAPNRAKEVSDGELQRELEMSRTKALTKNTEVNTAATSIQSHVALEKLLMEKSNADLQQKLGTQQLDQNATQLSQARVNSLLVIASLPKEKRQLALNSLLGDHQISPDTAAQVMGVSENAEDLVVEISKNLGPDHAAMYQHYQKQASKPVDPDKLALAKEMNQNYQDPTEQALSQMGSILKKYMDVRSEKQNWKEAPEFPKDEDGKLDPTSLEIGMVYKVPNPKDPKVTIPLRWTGEKFVEPTVSKHRPK